MFGTSPRPVWSSDDEVGIGEPDWEVSQKLIYKNEGVHVSLPKDCQRSKLSTKVTCMHSKALRAHKRLGLTAKIVSCCAFISFCSNIQLYK